MATKTKPDIDSELSQKVSDYAATYGVPEKDVIELALRDFFHDHDAGKRPRSNSPVEPVLGVS